MVTTVASSTIINWATAMMASARNRFGSRPCSLDGSGLRGRTEVMVVVPIIGEVVPFGLTEPGFGVEIIRSWSSASIIRN